MKSFFFLSFSLSIPALAAEGAPEGAHPAEAVAPEAPVSESLVASEASGPEAGEGAPAGTPTAQGSEGVDEPGVDPVPAVAPAEGARVLAPAATVAAQPPPAPPDPNTLPFTYHEKHIDVQVAFGPGWLTDSGIEPFSSSEGVALLGMRLGGAPLSVGRFAFAILAEGTYGSVSGSVRGSRSSLELGLLGLGLEARYHFHHLFYGFVRLSPGAGFSQASVDDAGVPLSGDGWAPTFSGHLGLAARIAGPADGSVRAPRVWLLLEGGYRYSDSYALTLRAPEDSPLNAAELAVPPFSLVGPDASVAAMLTF